MSKRLLHVPSVILSSVIMLAVSLVLTVPAWAREYEMVQTTIDATVGTDGSMDVQEERIFAFDGSFNGVYWNLPQGEFQGRYVTVDVVEAGEFVNGEAISYELSNSGDNNTYSIESYGSSLRLKIYARHSNENAHFYIVYRLNDVVSRHADVSELYWQFVTEGWDEETQNITCTVHLPVPKGESVTPEDNVRAWGHGPLDASLAFEGNDIVYTVPGVGSSEFAEARVTFPESWMPDAPQDSKKVLDSILAEEQAEADKANRRRMIARGLYYGSMAVAGIAALGTSVFAFIKRRAYKAAIKPQFDDKYFRDVPTNDHPAALGALYHNGNVTPELFTATLMNLTDRGIIALQHVQVERSGVFGSRLEDDYRLVATGKPVDDSDDSYRYTNSSTYIDRKAFDLMFEKVALGVSEEDYKDGTYPPMYFSSIEKYAEERPSSYENAYDNWENAVEHEYSMRFTMGKTTVDMPTGRLLAAGIIDFFLAVIFMFACLVFGTPLPIIIVGFVLLLAAGGYCIFSAVNSDDANEEGREVRAKLKALRNWLKDFTRLGEAIPTDVVLWNRLLVMAVVLGVADEVIKQLETVLPEVLHSEYLSNTYGWCYVSSSSNYTNPANTVTNAVSSAHSVSTASVAGSSWSSGGGGGGGFSGGGGGGFGGGGGGGGGAF